MFAQVVKVQGGFAVVDHNEEILVAYKNRKHAEQFLAGHEAMIWGGAEQENERRDMIAVYLAERANRVVVPAAQMELF